MGKTKRGKSCKVMVIADRSGLPVSVCAGSASPHETPHVLELLDGCLTAVRPEQLIDDQADDSDPLDEQCAVTMIAPHRANRRKPKTQDGRVLRRYRRRWQVERLFAWLQNYRRIVTRHERHFENLLAFLQLDTFMILDRKYL